jgi:hypothetical protein
VKILDLFKDLSLAEIRWHYGKNKSGILSTALNSMHPEHLRFSLHGGLLRTTYLWTPKVYYIPKN